MVDGMWRGPDKEGNGARSAAVVAVCRRASKSWEVVAAWVKVTSSRESEWWSWSARAPSSLFLRASVPARDLPPPPPPTLEDVCRVLSPTDRRLGRAEEVSKSEGVEGGSPPSRDNPPPLPPPKDSAVGGAGWRAAEAGAGRAPLPPLLAPATATAAACAAAAAAAAAVLLSSISRWVHSAFTLPPLASTSMWKVVE